MNEIIFKIKIIYNNIALICAKKKEVKLKKTKITKTLHFILLIII